MGRLVRPAGLIRAAVEHAERVFSVAEGEEPAVDAEGLSVSWRRSANAYGVDPADERAPNILTAYELKNRQEPLGKLILSAQEEIDRLYRMVRAAGYVLLLTDAEGVAVEHRGEDKEKTRNEFWGTWLGGVWSEEFEGTNGIGTCIAEERPVTIHRSQHFRSRNMDLSCSGAPVFGVDGKLVAILDVSAIDPERSEQAHALTGSLTVYSARAIEERFFREYFCREWIIALVTSGESAPGMLLAVDGSQRIVGANRAARTSLLLDDRGLEAGISLWTIFERDPELFRRNNSADIATRLVIAGSTDSRSALVTPPDPSPIAWRRAADDTLHARPRLDLVSSLEKTVSAPTPPHGGLSPGALRRVREYVEAHFSESTDLAVLASVAGLSIHHFARGFKQSAGVTPHYYLTQKRVERAQHLLTNTSLAVAEIAYSVGFSDQSHLTRHFRQILGVTPGQFRWSQR